MADLKITGLTSIAATTARGDLLHVIDDPSGTPINKKVTIGEMVNSLHTPIKLSAGTQALTEATHAGRMLIVPDQTAATILTLPTPKIGMSFQFTYGGIAADTVNTAISAGTGNSLFFLGGVYHLDIDGNTSAAVFSDNDSNELLTIINPQNYTVNCVGISATTWQLSGFVCSATVPTLGD